MWLNYEEGYRNLAGEARFREWRDLGAQRKAANIARICRDVGFVGVLEVGCGTGAILKRLCSMGLATDCVGMDVSVSAARSVREEDGRAVIRVVVGDACAIPFRDKTFSIIILSHVLEHLERPAVATREAARVARLLVIEVPTERVMWHYIKTRVLGRPAMPNSAGHIQFWSPRSVRRFLKSECQLEIVESQRDLLDRSVELYSKRGFGRAKAWIKSILKGSLPGSVYVWLFATHATFLCRSRQPGPQTGA